MPWRQQHEVGIELQGDMRMRQHPWEGLHLGLSLGAPTLQNVSKRNCKQQVNSPLIGNYLFVTIVINHLKRLPTRPEPLVGCNIVVHEERALGRTVQCHSSMSIVTLCSSHTNLHEPCLASLHVDVFL